MSVFALTVTFSVPVGSITNPPDKVLIVFPDNNILPVCTLYGLTILVLDPSVKLIPVSPVISNVGALKLTDPVSKLTLNKLPTLKLPDWSTLV